MLKPVLFINALCSLLLQSACATEPKTLPQPPYSEAQLNGFVNQEELAAVSKVSDIKATLARGHHIFDISDLLLDSKLNESKVGLVTLKAPAGHFKEIDLKESSYARDDERYMEFSPNTISFDKQGHVATVKFVGMEKSDIKYLNQLAHLQSISVRGKELEEGNVDFNDFKPNSSLVSLNLSGFNITNNDSLCSFDGLQFFGIDRSSVKDDLNFSGCLNDLIFIRIGYGNGKNIVIKDLPSLELLLIAKSSWNSITVDEKSLPRLKSVSMGNVNISSGFDKIQLPKDLPQLYLTESENDAITQLKLPENLQYLDLSKAQLSDYSFIRQAKNLRYLNLESSNFQDWALLTEFKHLQYLNLNNTRLDNDGIKKLAELKKLAFLSIANTPTTDLKSIVKLKNLFYFNASDTKVTFENFPIIATKGYIGFPSEDFYYQNNIPEPLITLRKSVFWFHDECESEGICFPAPWWNR